MKLPNFERILFQRTVPVFVLFLFLMLWTAVGFLFGWSVWHEISGGQRLGEFGKVMVKVASFPSVAKNAIHEIALGGPQVIPDRHPELDGFKKSGKFQAGALEDQGYLLLPSFDKDIRQTTVQLIRISDQKVLHQWIPDLEEISSMTSSEIIKSGIQIYHPLLLKNGDLLINLQFAFAKINRSSKLEWLIDGYFNHSTELDEDGNIWVKTILRPSSFEGVLSHEDDAICKLSASGEVLFKKSVTKILLANDYYGLLAAGFDNDPIHLNDIQPALTDSDYWNKGDLLLSLRNLSTIILYRPSTNKIIWLKTGPWMNQHDVDFLDNHRISVFGNDVIDDEGSLNDSRINNSSDGRWRRLLKNHNNIYIYDFHDNSVSTPYENSMNSMSVQTLTDGLCEVLPNGDVFIEETTEGRLLRLTSDSVKWEFVRRVDKNHVSIPSWSRYLTEEQVRDVLPKP